MAYIDILTECDDFILNSSIILEPIMSKAYEYNLTSATPKYKYEQYNLEDFARIKTSFEKIIKYRDSLSTVLNDRGMDLVLLSDQADKFICNAVDAFDRIIDIRSFLYDDTIIGEWFNIIYKIHREQLRLFRIKDDTIQFEDITDVDIINEKFDTLFETLETIFKNFESIWQLINLAESNLNIFSDTLRVNTTVGTALSVTTRSWNLAIKLNKHNYKYLITEEEALIETLLIDKSQPIDSFEKFPKYILRTDCENFIKDIGLAIINESFSININSVESLDIIVNNSDVIFDMIPELHQEFPSVSSNNYSKYNTMYNYNIVLNMIKDIFVIKNYKEIYGKILYITDSIGTVSETYLEDFLKINKDFDIQNCFVKNIKQYLKSKKYFDIINSGFSHKFDLSFDLSFDQVVPIDFTTNPLLYTNKYNNGNLFGLAVFDLIENNSSDTFDNELNVSFNNFISKCFDDIFQYSVDTKHSIITVYHTKKDLTGNSNRSVLKRMNINTKVLRNDIDIIHGDIYSINDILGTNMKTYVDQKYINCFLADKFIDIDNPLNTIEITFRTIFKYNRNTLILEDIDMLEEVKVETDGYLSNVKTTTSSYKREVIGDEHRLIGLSKIEHKDMTFNTDNYNIRIATNVSNTFRKMLIQGLISYNDARHKAISYTLLHLRFRAKFDTFIDQTWKNNIPRYMLVNDNG